MISSLRGRVVRASGGRAVLDVGGVGYAVQVTDDHARTLRVGAETTIVTSLIVREDSLTLYGFSDEERLGVFELLLGVSGVGPKSALGVLSVLEPAQIALAVASDDDAPFRTVSGIGPKTAKLIVVSLAGKLDLLAAAPSGADQPRGQDASADVVVALTGLGWPERVAREAVRDVSSTVAADERENVSDLLRAALARLGPAQPTAEAGTDG